MLAGSQARGIKKIDLAVPFVCQFILPLQPSHGHWWLQSPSHVDAPGDCPKGWTVLPFHRCRPCLSSGGQYGTCLWPEIQQDIDACGGPNICILKIMRGAHVC